MGTQLATWHLVEAPAAVPYRFGLFSQVTPRTSELTGAGLDEHWRLGVQWMSQACGDAKLTTGPCINSEVSPLTPDDYCSVSKFDPFTVYAYNNDDVPGFSMDEDVANAVARLTNGEQEAAETQVWNLATTAIGVDVVDLTAYPLWYGLGYIEQALAESYGAQGVIHMNRLTATMLADQLRIEGGRLFTLLGTPVVAGAGYEKIGATAPTEGLIYGTGPLVMYRGDVDTRQTAINKATNQASIIAQRDYVVGWDCVAVGAEVSLAVVEGA